jgi:DNA-binding FadR family transcriptional regulator
MQKQAAIPQEVVTPDSASSDMDVIRRIISYISERRVEPGERLPSERDFATRFGVGRALVREALQSLIAVRVIEARPNSGNYLREIGVDSSFEALVLLNLAGLPLSQEDIDQSLEARIILERETMRLACLRRTPEHLEKMTEIIEETRVAIEQKVPIEREDQKFHLAVAAATGNLVLVRLLNGFYELSRPRRRIYFQQAKHAVSAYREHIALYEAIAARDADKAEQIMTQHVGRARKYFGTAKT